MREFYFADQTKSPPSRILVRNCWPIPDFLLTILFFRQGRGGAKFQHMKEVATNGIVRGVAGTDSNVHVLSQWVTLYEFNMVKQRHCNMEKIMRKFLEKYVINSLIWENFVILWKNINCLVHFLRKWLIFSKNIMFFHSFPRCILFQNSSDLSLLNN